jgi:WD40 repeat protein
MSVAFDPHGQFWATGSTDGEVKIWHCRLPDEQLELVRDPPYQHMAGATDETLVLGGDFPAEGRNMATGEVLELPPARQACRISADGRWIVSVTREANSAREAIQVWDRHHGALRHDFRLPEESTITDRSLAISRTGRWLATRTWSGPLRLWDLSGEQPKQAHTLTGDCMDLAFSPDEQFLAAGCQFGRVRLWDVSTGLALPDVWGYESGVVWCQRVAFSFDGRRLAAGTDHGVVRVFDLSARQLLSTLSGHLGQTLALHWFPDGKTLAVAGTGPIRLWDVEIGQECLALAVPDYKTVELALSSDGSTLFSRGDQHIVRLFPSAPRAP